MKGLGRRTKELQESKGKENKRKKDIRILLVNAHELVRYGLQRMLEPEEDMEVVGDCANAEKVFSEIARLHPDIVLMDTQMPGMNGIETTHSLKQNGLDYDSNIIILAESVDYQVKAMEAGAASYLLKDMTRTELTQTIREVYQNKQSPEDHENLVEETVELVIPPLPETEAAQLLRFVCHLEEILKDSYASIAQMFGSWDWGTVITVSLGFSSLTNILEKLNSMPDVEKAEEGPTARGVFSSYPKKFGVLPESRTSPKDSILITMKQPSIARQGLTAVLN